MKKDKESKNAAYGAIFFILVIGMLVIFNHYTSGWDRYLGFQPSFLTVFFSFLGIIVVCGIVGFWLWNRPRRQRRTKYDYHPNIQRRLRRRI